MSKPHQTGRTDRVAELRELGQRVARHALKAGADAAEVLVAEGMELAAKVRLGEPELVHEAGSKALGLRVLRDHRVAVTYTSDFGAGLERFVEETVTLAELSEPDELNELPDPSGYATEIPDLDLWDERALSTTAHEALEMAKEAERAARGFSSQVTNSEGATYSRNVGSRAFVALGGPKQGGAEFAGGYRGTYQSLVVEPICDDKDGKKRNGYHWTGARFVSALEPPEVVGRKAAERTAAKLGAEKIPTATLPVVFDADAGRGLLNALFGVISGGAIYRRSSYLVDREGTEIASPLVTIVDDPLLPRAPGSRPFDGEGLRARRTVVVERGQLVTYLFDTYSARKLGRTSNGSAGRSVGGSPHVTHSNFLLQPGTTPEAELLRGIERGLYVTDMMGFGFNSVTGDFSRGASGFLIENGQLGRPVSEVTISLNFDDLWKSIDAVGDRLEMKTSTACPAFRVAAMTVAGY
ncbi:MAG TPA: TldD/PmbA family protein [Polyangia bacterium]|jgi:PmbA protein|nr:TldD/PmbA family protein [Polyangia bacterium]